MSGYWLLTPEYLLLVGAVAALFGDLLPGGERSSAMLGSLIAFAAAGVAWFAGTSDPLFGGMLVLDPMSVFARVAMAALTGTYLLWIAGRGTGSERSYEATALALFSTVGAMLMVGARDLVTLFIAIELATMPAYVLMGYRRDDDRGLEGALKYFLLSLTTSLVMLYGFSFLFGITGTTLYAGMDVTGAGVLGVLAIAFVFVGLFAKLSAAPFHYWAPDAYAGAPISSVAFVSTVPKIAGTIALVRLIEVLAPGAPQLPLLLAAVSVMSMVLGNFAAYPQRDIRRLMAYSGIAHVGYVVLALVAGTATGSAVAVFYTVAYALPSMAVVLVAGEEGAALDRLAGLANRRPWAAWSLVVFLLSLIGVPPMVGFFGKLYLFTSAFSAGYGGLVILAVVMAVVSAGYYLRMLREAFFGENAFASRVTRSLPAAIAIGLLVIATLLVGVVASPLLGYLGVSF
jgi:NADH-quinone oxidoreductase subunit N